MLAEFRSVFADFGRPDQDVKRAAEPAALSGNDLVVHPPLRRAHLIRGDLAITAHSSWLSCWKADRITKPSVSRYAARPQARLRRIKSPTVIFPQNAASFRGLLAALLPNLLPKGSGSVARKGSVEPFRLIITGARDSVAVDVQREARTRVS